MTQSEREHFFASLEILCGTSTFLCNTWIDHTNNCTSQWQSSTTICYLILTFWCYAQVLPHQQLHGCSSAWRWKGGGGWQRSNPSYMEDKIHTFTICATWLPGKEVVRVSLTSEKKCNGEIWRIAPLFWFTLLWVCMVGSLWRGRFWNHIGSSTTNSC